MRPVLLTVAIVGYVFCVGWALLPALTPFYFTDAFMGMSACALIAITSSPKSYRWLAVAFLGFSLAGAAYSWRHNSTLKARMLEQVTESRE